MCYIDICYECFVPIALDKNIVYSLRADACRYLFGSENEVKKEISQECLLDIINDLTISSEIRYRIIHSFTSKSGIKSIMNSVKIPVPYDEMFLYGLQHDFFNEKANGIRERILSGQNLLQISCTPDTTKQEICTELLSVASDHLRTENERADAADVVLRMGSNEFRVKAKEVINSLGFSTVSMKNANVMDRFKTIYTNSQKDFLYV